MVDVQIFPVMEDDVFSDVSQVPKTRVFVVDQEWKAQVCF